MRIWLVNHYALPPSGSGPGRHHALALDLTRRGHDVTVVASGFEHYARETRMREGTPWQVEVVGGVRYVWVRTRPYSGAGGRVRAMFSFAAGALRWSKRFEVPAPDVVLGSSPHLLAPAAAFGIARRFGVPFVLEIRDVWPASVVDLLGVSRWNPAVLSLRLLERLLYRQADMVVTVLPAVADYLIGRGADRHGIRWIPNGVDLASVPAPRAEPEPPPFVVMYAGTLGLVNGLDVVLDAAHLLADRQEAEQIQIRLVGPGPAWDRLAGRVRDEDLDNVRVEPAVPKAEVHELLSEANAFLMVLEDAPVFRFGVSPNKLFDYFAAARPVLFAVRTPENPVDAAGAGVTVEPGDSLSMAEGMVRLASLSSEARRAMGRRGASYVRREHDYAVLAERLERVLEEVTATSPNALGDPDGDQRPNLGGHDTW